MNIDPSLVMLGNQMLVLWIVLNGIAFMLGGLTGDPMKYVKKMNGWLFKTTQKTIAGALRALANLVSGKW